MKDPYGSQHLQLQFHNFLMNSNGLLPSTMAQAMYLFVNLFKKIFSILISINLVYLFGYDFIGSMPQQLLRETAIIARF